jgi:putative ABC transport system permease protein
VGVLNRKLGRELLRGTSLLVTVVAIISVGTGAFVGLLSAQRILESSQASYYARYRFADFWVEVKKAPLSAVEPLAELDGVADLEARVVFDVILDVPGTVRPLAGRLISAPARGHADTINGMCLVRGSGFSDDRAEEVILGEAFAAEHGLAPGDRIDLILNRKRESFIVVGTAISPEYVYMVRGEGDFVPDPEHFGILYVKENYAREVLDFEDACNQIVGQLLPGHTENVDLLLARMEAQLEPYGVLATVPRERQASHRFLSDEIRGLAITAVIMPTLFLVVAAMVLNVVLSRLVQRQRTIIGTLKALGYTDGEVFGHYLGFGVVIGLAGGVAGNAVGLLIAYGLVQLYPSFFQFPSFLFRVYPDLLVTGVGISLLFSVAGTVKGVWTVLGLAPAEAMRVQPPERGGAVFLERIPRLWRRLGFRSHIALRSLARNRVRTLTGVLAQGFAVAMIFATLALYDSMWYLVEFQFEEVLHSDVDIGLRDERSMAALLEVERLPGVDYAEPLLGMVFDFRNGPIARRVAVTGLPPGHRLTTPRRADLGAISIPADGLMMSEKLAEILGTEVGDTLVLTPVRGRREPVTARIAATMESFLGLECYADQRYLSRLVGEARAVNSVQTDIDPARKESLYRALKQLPNAQGLGVRADTKHNIESTFVETTASTLGLMIVFAGVIALGTMLNASLLEIGDRTRDISTFRVLGYRPAQIAGIFLRQNLVVFALGLLLAYPLGYLLVLASAQAYATELFRMPVIIKLQTALLSGVIALAFTVVVQLAVYRYTRRLDWLEGIKIKE